VNHHLTLPSTACTSSSCISSIGSYIYKVPYLSVFVLFIFTTFPDRQTDRPAGWLAGWQSGPRSRGKNLRDQNIKKGPRPNLSISA